MAAKRPWVEHQCPFCAGTFSAPARAKVEPYDNCRSKECEPQGEAAYQAALAAWKASPERQARRAAAREVNEQRAAVAAIGGGWSEVGALVTGLSRKARRQAAEKEA